MEVLAAVAASRYDFIVVGAGSAGCVVASRLSENPDARVLVIEAGGGPDEVPENVHNPSIWFTLFGSPIDWGYSSVPQPGLDGRQTYEPRGKLIGGSSNLYIMMHIPGHRADYDNWAYNGCPGWSYDDCLPYFQKQEEQDDDTNPTAGKHGPIPVYNAGKHGPNPTSALFIDACKELGFPETADFNGPNMEGAGWHHINVKDGRRASTAEGYLIPALGRPNLTLKTGAYATRLILNRKRATGVEYVQDGTTHQAHADAEIIVCLGALESPKLLMLSGIGEPAHLKEHGIAVHVGLPGVGKNFHNHVLTGVIRECKQPLPPPQQNQSESALFCRSDPGWNGPDLQIAFLPIPFNIIVGQGHPNSMSILPGVVRPLSRGWIKLASGNPLDKPLVNPNYLGVDADRERLVQGVKLARDIFAASAFSEWAGDELMPGPDVQGDEALDRVVRQSADSYHHQAGSCRMGLDDLAVVDPQLRVHGVEGLRVADASVFPQVQSGNCHAGIVMAAERCADWVKATQGA